MKKTSKRIYLIFIIISLLIFTFILCLNQNSIIKTEEKLQQYTTIVGTENDLKSFNYTKDDIEKTVTLTQHYFVTTDETVNIYEKYNIAGEKYTTIIQGKTSFFGSGVGEVNFCGNIKITEVSGLFKDCRRLRSIDFGDLQYEGTLEDMSNMFENCSLLTDIDLSNFDTSNVKNMTKMFKGCSSLTNINLSNFNTSNVTNMYAMFENCSSLIDLNLSNFNTSKVTDMYGMFKDCWSLVNLNLSNWNTSKLLQASNMFENCKSIKELNLSNFDLSKANYTLMFDMCDFDILVTPKAINSECRIYLPCTMYDDDGTQYDSLPTTSKTLYKERPSIQYNVTFKTDGGMINSGYITKYTEGIGEILPTNVTKQGYTFAGWYTNSSLSGTPVTEISSTETGDKTYYAKWTAATNTPYTQEWYYQNETLDGYELTETETYTGITGEKVYANFRPVMGYTGWHKNSNHPNYKEEGIVEADGSLVLKIFWDRDTYNVNLNLNGGSLEGENITSYTYGVQEITLPNATKEGYEFLGWWYTPYAGVSVEPISPERIEKITKTMVGDVEATARWEEKSDTPYKVIHHFRNLDTEVEGYSEEEEQKTGTTGEIAIAEYKTVEGFTKNESDSRTVKQGTVAADGSLVLHLYYTRNSYNITYELNGGTLTSPLTNSYTYGKELILQTNRVTKEGYKFAGWYDNEQLTGSPVTSISSTSTGNKTFYAKWVDVEQEYYILSEIYNIDLTENIVTKVSSETTVTDFLSKIETNGEKKVLNAKGQEIAGNTLVGTGCKLQVTFKGEIHTYEIAVRGDLDGNGKVTTTDLSIINQQILHKIELTGIKAKAADTDYNGKLTTTDLSMINQAVLRKITL